MAAWDGSRDSLTRCEVEMFLSVDRGHRTAVKDHETGESWHGSVDLTFPEQGFVWVISDLGERKLLDITVGEDFAAEKRLSDTAAGRSIRPRSRPGWIGPWPRASCEICSWCQYMNCRARVSIR